MPRVRRKGRTLGGGTLVTYGAAFTCVGVSNLAIAVILRVDMDDEVWPRAIALEDVRGLLAPGVGFGAAF